MENIFEYEMLAQFVNPKALFDDSVKPGVEKAIKSYNSRSLIAANPKQITKYSYSDDMKTLTLTLQSQKELPMPSKGLRLFSSILVEDPNIGKLISGKNLLKMISVPVSSDISESVNADKSINKLSTEEFNKLSIDEKLNEIYRILTGGI